MSTTQHPLTDETRDRLVSYISGGTIDCSSEEGRYDSLTAADARGIVDSLWGPMAEAALAAVRDHECTTNPAAGTDRPWEPLNVRRVYVGDEVRQELRGVTTTGVVGHLDEDGDPCATEGGFIGELCLGTWYVRRPVQELPPERDGVVLVAADGHESITTTDGQEFSRLIYSKELSKWYGPNLAQLGEYVIQTTSLSRLIPGTWKVGDQ